MMVVVVVVVVMVVVCGVDRLAQIPAARQCPLRGSTNASNSANLCLASCTQIYGPSLLYPLTSADHYSAFCVPMCVVTSYVQYFSNTAVNEPFHSVQKC